MGISIKNPETEKLARTLAELTGESMTAAITEAVRERLERLQRDRERDARLEKLTAIADRCAKYMKLPFTSTDIGEWLYDEKGLPK